jgi:hypothetical protein
VRGTVAAAHHMTAGIATGRERLEPIAELNAGGLLGRHWSDLARTHLVGFILLFFPDTHAN